LTRSTVLKERRHVKETSWSYVAAIPSKTVQAWGCTFGGFSEYAATSIDRLEPPAATAVMVLCCGEPVTLQPALSSGSSSRLYAFHAGLQVQAQRVTHTGINDCVEIRLPPLAAYALFGGAMAEPNSEPVNLLDTAPQLISILLDRLRDTGAWEQRLAAVNQFLQHGFADSTWRPSGELIWAWETFERSHGQIAIRALAQAIGWSERHLIDRFRTHFGVRPKATARRLRFSHALNLVITHPTRDLSMIAAQAGFSDQSHMNREFQTFSGLTPGVLRTARFNDLPGIPAAVLRNR
jgi:AraC-like DNA-binding protein